MSEQHEEEILRRWAREQAEIERQTDALVLKALTAMVTAAEDLKSKLRRDIEGVLEEYRRTKRGLENEISLATAERQRFRREVEHERDSILSEAQAKAREIVAAAELERETLLTEVRSMEHRLRTLEEQIRSVFGIELPAQRPSATDDDDDEEPASEPEASGQFVPASVATLTTRPAPPSAPAPRAAAAPPSPPQDDSQVVEAVAPAAPTASVRVQPSPAAPATAPAAISFDDDDDDESAGLVPEPAAASSRSAGPRRVELVFDGVPGYQQASTLEMAVGDLLPDGEVDIVEFERGQLVLSAQASDLEDLANQLVASTPASLQLTAVTGDRATFRCV